MDQLPNEILLKILKHLSTLDLMSYCIATGEYFFLNENEFVRTINLSGEFAMYNFPLCDFFLKYFDYIAKTLKLNFLYWLSDTDIKRMIYNLPNLEELQAVDTKFELEELECEAYLKIKKLAISLKSNQVTRGPSISNNLKSLYLKISEIPFYATDLVEFMGNFTYLEELWICNDEEKADYIDYESIALNLKNLKKFVIKTISFIPYFDLNHLGLFKVFDRRSKMLSVLIFEKLVKPEAPQVSESKEKGIRKYWKYINKYHTYFPCGARECRELYLKKNINDIYFEDLNFASDPYLCSSQSDDEGSMFSAFQIECKSDRYYKYILRLLCSKNAKHLKRLSVRSCQALCYAILKIQTKERRKMKNVAPSERRPELFDNISTNIRNLKELELLHCPKCRQDSDFATCCLIDIFESLEKVTLILETQADGSFLKEVFLKCPHLYSLNITCFPVNERFIHNLCECLQYLTNLRDFRLDHEELRITNIVKSLSDIRSKKLLRVVLKCRTLHQSYHSLFTNFVEANPQLMFLYVAASKETIDRTEMLQETFDKLRCGNPVKIFLVKLDKTRYFLDAPPAHRDLLLSRTNVSVVSVEDFF